MDKVNEKLLNSRYAPGIATYGIDGKTGPVGSNGTSIYFTSYDMSDSGQYQDALIKINQGRIVSDNTSLPNTRPYGIGDLFFDCVGSIWQLVEDNTSNFSLNYLASIDDLLDSDYFDHSNNRVFLNCDSSTVKGIDLLKGDITEDQGTSDFTLRVINKAESSSSGNYNLVSMIAKPINDAEKYLNIVYDQNLASFKFISNTNIMVDCPSFSVSPESTGESRISDFYRIDPMKDPIGLLHKVYSESTWSLVTDTKTDGTEVTYIQVTIPKEKFISSDLIDVIPDAIRVKTYVSNNWKAEYLFETANAKEIVSDDETYKIKVGENAASAETDAKVSLIKGIEIYIKKA